MTISLGHRDANQHEDGWLEPIVAITKDGRPVADAMVFCRLVSTPKSAPVGDEIATVYEVDPSGTQGRYAQSKLRLPENDAEFAVRFRIILPETDEEWTRDVVLPSATMAK